MHKLLWLSVSQKRPLLGGCKITMHCLIIISS